MTTRTEPKPSLPPRSFAPLAPPRASDIDDELAGLAGQRVAIALSGGVDSAVAAERLVAAGAEVVGLALRLHDPDPTNPLAPRACCPPDDLQDARRVAERLGFPFYVVDARAAFDEAVVRPFVRSYLAGRTPNPCVGCNAFVKLERLHRRARALGCARLATGHYARRRLDASGAPHLFTGVDDKKDQSYFLFGTGPEILRDLVFPLGAWTKSQVRKAALERGLPVAHKLESQEVCFVGGAGAGGFVMRQPEAAGDHEGPIVDREGRVLGTHDGVMGFTVGQRRGIGVASRRPLHVLALDAETRSVTVGPVEQLEKASLRAGRVSWPAGVPAGSVRARVKIRYRDPGTEAQVEATADGGAVVRFERPVRAVAPGQAAVFYAGEEIVGGGWIEESLD